MYKKIFLPLFLFLLVQTAVSQTVETKDNNGFSEETRKQAVEFLRETSADVNNLRSLENRISFAAEVASIMWFSDEKEARSMYQTLINDFKQLLSQYDSQINAMGVFDKEEYYGGGLFGGETDEKGKLMRKFNKAIAVRQQIASSIAEHDPQLAFDFFDTSLQAITNEDMRKRLDNDSYFVTRLLKEIAEKDAGKALEFGRKNLSKGVNYEHIELLKKIYAKDADKGAEFGEEVAKKLKETKIDNEDYYLLGSVVNLGVDSLEKAKKDKKKPMISESMMRELTEVLAQTLLKGDEPRGAEYLDEIEKFAPSRAVQMRARMNNRNSGSNKAVYGSNSASVMTNRIDVPPPGNALTSAGDNSEVSPEEQLTKGLASLQNKDLPKEERDKAVGKARKIIAEMPSKMAKITALSGLASQIYKAGDKDLATEIMREAQGFVNLQPKNYQDYIEIWLLINGFAQSDAEKAFPILEDTISRMNETLGAFIKVAEFIDVNGDIIDDGEVQVGGFGGSMIREVTSGLGQSDNVLQSLAKTDFARTKALTNRFDQPEVRVLAKMLVLRAVFGEQKKDNLEIKLMGN